MKTRSDIGTAIAGGLRFIQRAQAADGSFASAISHDQNQLRIIGSQKTTFFTSLILDCLNSLENTAQRQWLRSRAAAFLLANQKPGGSWNYWPLDSAENKTRPYPDDLDDTFCAMSALVGCGAKKLDGATWAALVRILTVTETQPGGPYNTWIGATGPEWQDVDLAVNSNVAYFLATQKIYLPNVTALIESAIAGRQFFSRYYHSAYPIIYFMARFYKGSKTSLITDYLLESYSPQSAWGNPLATALAAAALLRLGVPSSQLSGAVDFLLQTQHRGGWPGGALYIDAASGGRRRYAGSPALTTAFCLEALARYKAANSLNYRKNRPATNKVHQELASEIAKRATARFEHMDKDLAGVGAAMVKKVAGSQNGREIMLLPCLLNEALARRRATAGPGLLARLGLASLYGWIAYTIYDDFLDQEGSPWQLPLANTALRELTLILHGILPGDKAFNQTVESVLDGMESANCWEVTHCRAAVEGGSLKIAALPDYGNLGRLAERSLGHALAPLALLHASVPRPARESRALLNFFHHYLIARQLNDDAHDWETDLARGHINSVASLLIKAYHPGKRQVTLELSEAVPEMRKIFWSQKIKTVSGNIFEEARKARTFLAGCPSIWQPENLLRLLRPIELSARKALDQSSQAADFIKAYQSGR